MSDIVERLKENTVTISEAMRQRAMAAQEIERCRQDEINAIEYRRVLADEIERLNAQTLALVREVRTLRGLLREAQNYVIDVSDHPGADNPYKQAANDCWQRIDAALAADQPAEDVIREQRAQWQQRLNDTATDQPTVGVE